MQSGFLDVDKAAEFLSVKKSTIYSYTHKKILPHYKPSGRKIYFKISDLENFVLNPLYRVKSDEEMIERIGDL